MIKDCADCLAQPLSYIINLFVSAGIFPDEWKIAKVVPLYKGGEGDKFENYRPVSVLPVMAKIAEGIVYKRLFDHLSKEPSNKTTIWISPK